jgi:hypothetical protein
MNLSKKLIYIITFGLLATISCDREFDSEGVSRITTYATLTMQGEVWNRITQGGTWTDPGVTAKEGTADIEVTVGGDVVDVNTPGAYAISYTATNKDGFSSTIYRYVGVISPNVEGIDITGAYKRNAGAMGVSTVTKIDENLYTSDNVGGVATGGPSTTVYFYHYDDGLLAVPSQDVMGSTFSCEDATIDVGVSYSWVVINSGYGAALRTFVKQ